EISTDKVDAEIPAPVAGVLLEIKVQPGETVAISTVVAVIGVDGEPVSTDSTTAHDATPVALAPPPPVAVAPSPPPVAVAAGLPQVTADTVPAAATAVALPISLDDRRRIKSSPVVRKIASQHDIDIRTLRGSGIGGRVTKQDILAVVEARVAHPVAVAATAAAPAPAAPPAPSDIPEAYRPRILPGDRVEEMSTMRAKIALHMVLSKRESAHVSTVWEVDFSRVAELRRKHKDEWKERHDVSLTFTAFIMKATVDALKAFPVLNASIATDVVIYHRDINLGLAVALDWGLLVPVIKKADELNLLGLARHAADLVKRARTKKLMPDEVQNGTFTITNPGVFGPMFGIPVINQPQVGILGVGAIEKRPVVIDDMIAIRTRAYLSMSFDHRLVDGATADQFMARVNQEIENFDEAEL
ncbi:MAG: dihydrolipoamide acetyltransferase family protein, partial [Myxococcota bacterium]